MSHTANIQKGRRDKTLKNKWVSAGEKGKSRKAIVSDVYKRRKKRSVEKEGEV